MASTDAVDITPSARRLTESLRDVGYDFVSAVADLVDNSLSAGAERVDVVIEYDGPYSTVVIADDGCGMTQAGLGEALRLGSRRERGYAEGELGRYGLGLKTASLSQCRRVTVVSRHAPRNRRISALTLDLDRILTTDSWGAYDPWDTDAVQRGLEWLESSTGTVVVWENLDRVLPYGNVNGSWPRRKFKQLADRTSDYLGMVFHRFLEGNVVGSGPLTLTVNGAKVTPWNPFAPEESERIVLPEQSFEVPVGEGTGNVEFQGCVLPNRDKFSSPEEFDRMAGPRKWNRQQGIYVYRAHRLIQSGGWCGLRAADEHTKLARASLDFRSDLDVVFRVNIAKMRVTLPSEIRSMLEQPVNELCRKADEVYRRSGFNAKDSKSKEGGSPANNNSGLTDRTGLLLRSSALEIGEYESLQRIMSKVRERDPSVASVLGW